MTFRSQFVCFETQERWSMRILITGGAGFIGCHATYRLAAGNRVTVLDNLSRPGANTNLAWLRQERDFSFIPDDIRDAAAVAQAVARTRPNVVLHLASQVAVTNSVRDPRHDFEVNALGTFNVLEAVRAHTPEALVIYASTNKVYGAMEDVGIVRDGDRYRYAQLPHGIAEDRALDCHSPYGCSKGAGDQYVRDYARIYRLRTVVFRQSCIYGTRQFGMEDQGWLAWFAICSALGRTVRIYGDGFQVRDVLWVEDLLDAYEAAIRRAETMSGQVYNVGGGPANQISLCESLAVLERLAGRPVERIFEPSRPGDQRVFIADTRLAQRELGWLPRVSPADGLPRLLRWVQDYHQPLNQYPTMSPVLSKPPAW
jgi:CDP-paratose 2-epimerase